MDALSPMPLNNETKEFIRNLLKDETLLDDLSVIIPELEKSMNAAAQNPAAGRSLSDAFNNVASVTSLLRKQVETHVADRKAGKKTSPILEFSMWDYGKLLKMAPKLAGIRSALIDGFKNGDPVIVSAIQSLTQNPVAVTSLKNLVPKLLPPEIQSLLGDKDVVGDLAIILTEAEKEIAAAGASTADTDLKAAFNDVATALTTAKAYLQTGDISSELIMELGLNLSKYKKSGETLRAAYEAKDAAVTTPFLAIGDNETVREAVMRIIPRTYGSLFTIELDDKGNASAVATLGGNTFSFPLDKTHYAVLQKALGQKGTPGAARKSKGPTA